MKGHSFTEKLLIKEVTQISQKLKEAIKGLSVGILIKSIRIQLGMSQKILAKRAGVPQSTVSRIEAGKRDVNLSTLHKILNAMSCDLVIAPLLKKSIEDVRREQAKKIAEKQISYLEGTMNLENQKPDSEFMGELLREEEEHLLHRPGSKLWED